MSWLTDIEDSIASTASTIGHDLGIVSDHNAPSSGPSLIDTGDGCDRAALFQASGGNTQNYQQALKACQIEQQRLRQLQASDPLPSLTDYLPDFSGISDFFGNVGGAAKNAATTLAIGNVVLIAIVLFVLYKFLTSDSGKTIVVSALKR